MAVRAVLVVCSSMHTPQSQSVQEHSVLSMVLSDMCLVCAPIFARPTISMRTAQVQLSKKPQVLAIHPCVDNPLPWSSLHGAKGNQREAHET